MIIAVGTTSEQKIGYLKEILRELNIDADIIPCEVKSLVSNQPLTSEETKQGSINRAKHAFELTKESHSADSTRASTERFGPELTAEGLSRTSSPQAGSGQAGKPVDFAIGMEVGYEMNNRGKYEIFCWTSIVDREGNVVSGQSSNFLMPNFFQGIIKKNEYVGFYLDEYMKTHSHIVEKSIGEMIRNRKPFIVDATRKALMYHLKKDDFQL